MFAPLVVPVLVLIGGLWFLVWMCWDRGRASYAKRWPAVAAEMGFSVHAANTPRFSILKPENTLFPDAVKHLFSFLDTRKLYLHGIMEGEVKGRRVTFLDYQYETGDGIAGLTRTVYHTLCMVERQFAGLPPLVAYRRGLIARLMPKSHIIDNVLRFPWQ